MNAYTISKSMVSSTCPPQSDAFFEITRPGPGRAIRGLFVWGMVLGIVAFGGTWIGGRFLVRKLVRPPESPPLEAECAVVLPTLVAGEKLSSGLEDSPRWGYGIPSADEIRSQLLQGGVHLPVDLEIHVSPTDVSPSDVSSTDVSPSDVSPTDVSLSDPGSSPHDGLIAPPQSAWKGVSVRFVYRSKEPGQASQTVEEAGSRLVQFWQTQWDRYQAQRQAQLQQALQQAQFALDSLAQQKEDFLEQYIAELESAVSQAESMPASEGSDASQFGSLPGAEESPTRKEGSDQSPLENPQWTAWDQKLQQLQTHRQKLLEHRTPIHPEVQQVEAWIAQTQEFLAKTPRWLSPPGIPPQNDAPLATLSSILPLPSTERDYLEAHSPQIVPTALGHLPERLEEFRVWWEVFQAREDQAWQLDHQSLEQAQKVLDRLEQEGGSGLVKLQTTVRALVEGENRPSDALTLVSLVAGLMAAGLTLGGILGLGWYWSLQNEAWLKKGLLEPTRPKKPLSSIPENSPIPASSPIPERASIPENSPIPASSPIPESRCSGKSASPVFTGTSQSKTDVPKPDESVPTALWKSAGRNHTPFGPSPPSAGPSVLGELRPENDSS